MPDYMNELYRRRRGQQGYPVGEALRAIGAGFKGTEYKPLHKPQSELSELTDVMKYQALQREEQEAQRQEDYQASLRQQYGEGEAPIRAAGIPRAMIPTLRQSQGLPQGQAPVADAIQADTSQAPPAKIVQVERQTDGSLKEKVVDNPAYKIWAEGEEAKFDITTEEAKTKFEKMTAQEIAMSSLEPKIAYMMDVGGRGYREFKEEAKERFGVDVNFEKGGVEFWKANLLKKGMDMGKLLPVLDAADKLRPEIGFEVMRQIGPFRSAQAGMVFTETLADFTGHIPTDIAKSATTMTKSFAGGLGNKALVEEVFGRELSREEQIQKTKEYEANLLRGYNKAYRQMGITENFHGAGLSLETIAENSKFTDTEEMIIDSFQKKYPDKTRKEIIISAIDEGIL